ncbi:CDP-glucose 4,6-dehydratase [Legionella massiliensis]|uniref:CDP-glucose 4,6-dehydratase n=1 Tax=Legionella massiliensis TaxID=1034943 RepID=A0A078KT19_9GAMM|nr:CDP-glucose 4,6-dehydratase [Legionella massiliensis]CDZ76211.1 CDP-glucose 4,6-dehydratase [Legionella massiliensis]CEE11949.1 CDP-glucose 4,6-dehydratase [Legionella massiliensis]
MSLLPFEQSLTNKKILVTGHTGFTGGWACLWLQRIGAKLAGYSLPPNTSPSLFDALNLQDTVPTTLGDLCDYDALLKTVDDFQPDMILHLAAQPLVRRSYQEPVRTFAVNSQGTVHVLEAARLVKSVKAVLCVTTDKVYKNKEWLWPYREEDALGGKDPYSASKAAAEMVIYSYAASYPWQENKGPAIAIARGGNIIGGGDWSEDRLIPDFVRAVTSGDSMTLRYPDATRPWQHVLALVHGYMMLLAGLISDNPATYARAWNLGPQDPQSYSVRDVLELMCECWERPKLNYMQNPLPEASALALDSSMAKALLKWSSVWDTKQVIAETAAWYREYYANSRAVKESTLGQIELWRDGLR